MVTCVISHVLFFLLCQWCVPDSFMFSPSNNPGLQVLVSKLCEWCSRKGGFISWLWCEEQWLRSSFLESNPWVVLSYVQDKGEVSGRHDHTSGGARAFQSWESWPWIIGLGRIFCWNCCIVKGLLEEKPSWCGLGLVVSRGPWCLDKSRFPALHGCGLFIVTQCPRLVGDPMLIVCSDLCFSELPWWRQWLAWGWGQRICQVRKLDDGFICSLDAGGTPPQDRSVAGATCDISVAFVPDDEECPQLHWRKPLSHLLGCFWWAQCQANSGVSQSCQVSGLGQGKAYHVGCSRVGDPLWVRSIYRHPRRFGTVRSLPFRFCSSCCRYLEAVMSWCCGQWAVMESKETAIAMPGLEGSFVTDLGH